MENQRIIIIVGLLFVSMLLWQSWEVRHMPAQTATATQPTATADAPQPAQADGSVPDLPPQRAETAVATPQQSVIAQPQAKKIRVTTDVLDIEISSAGGDIKKAALLAYPLKQKNPEDKILLMNDTMPRYFVAQSGLISRGAKLPDHHTIYRVEDTDYRLAEGQNEIKVNLFWEQDGVKVTKQLTFTRDSYQVTVDYFIENSMGQPLSLAMYRQLARGSYVDKGENSFIYTFTGAVVSNSANKYEKIEFEDMAEWKAESDYAKGGFVAMLQHYFIGAWLTQDSEDNRFYTKQLNGDRYVVGMTMPEKVVEAGSTEDIQSRMYIGPKLQARMKEAQKDLHLTVDYGILTIIADPLFWLLTHIHGLLGNWGWAIIFLTILIKLAFYKLTETQYRSMANLRKLQPKMEALKERFGEDRQKLGQAMMELYKKEKVNPLAGCVPILVQIPVFIALYWVLVESVEMRQAPFMLWITDMSSKDPYFILPVLMAVSMFIMQKLSPAPGDPMQAKVMMTLPFVFGFFFAFFPSGLVLYWFVNNLLSILQQWYITRKVIQGEK